jgi:hypothetical protein
VLVRRSKGGGEGQGSTQVTDGGLSQRLRVRLEPEHPMNSTLILGRKKYLELLYVCIYYLEESNEVLERAIDRHGDSQIFR